MFPKRKGVLVRCYKDGVPIGEKPTPEWEKELGIPRQSIYDSTFKGSIARGHYLFVKVKAEDDEPEPPKHPTLSEVNAEAKAQGKSYAELQKEETLAMLKTAACDSVEVPNGDETEEDMESTEETAKPAENAILTLCTFAEMVDETIIIVYDINENWILTAPNTSAAFNMAEWSVVSLRAGMMDGKPILKVVVD